MKIPEQNILKKKINNIFEFPQMYYVFNLVLRNLIYFRFINVLNTFKKIDINTNNYRRLLEQGTKTALTSTWRQDVFATGRGSLSAINILSSIF